MGYTYTFQIVVGLKYENLDVLCHTYNINVPDMLSEIKTTQVDEFLDERGKNQTNSFDTIAEFIRTYDPLNSLELLEIIPTYISSKLSPFLVIKGRSHIMSNDDNNDYEFIVGHTVDTGNCSTTIDSIKYLNDTFTSTFGAQPNIHTFWICE